MSLAFFDVDGTLLPLPSLELRFFWKLAAQGAIPPVNYLRWLGRAAHLAPWNSSRIAQANKAYLRAVPVTVFSEGLGPLPEFFPAAVQRVWWHALRGDRIVLVTGTPAELAAGVKNALERELLWRGVDTQLSILATRLETANRRCTGRVLGEPMLGREKASAIAQFAAARNICLAQCSAYGDHRLDGFMLAAVGNPFAINPDRTLRRTAELYGWPVVRWNPRRPRTLLERNFFGWKGETAR